MKIEGGAPSISDPAVIAASLRCGGAGLLDLVQVHRRILGEVLAGTASPDTTQEVLEAACGVPRRRMTGGTAQDPGLARRSRASMTVSAMSMS